MRFALLLLAASLFAQPNSNWSTPIQALQKPTTLWESPSSCGIRATYIDGSNNLWIGGCAGVWTAPMSCIATDPATARARSCYTDVSAGIPSLGVACTAGTLQSTRDFDTVGGNVYAAFSNPCNNGDGTYVGFWNGSSWTMTASRPTSWTASEAITRIVHDGSNNIFAAGSNGAVWKTTNLGSSWTNPTGWQLMGYGGGNIFGMHSAGGFLYWGGEGPEIRDPVASPTTGCNILSGDNGSPNASKNFSCATLNTHQYAHNGRCVTSDGTASVAAASEVLVCIDDITAGTGMYMQRYDVQAGTWSRPLSPTIPSPGSGTTDGYFVLELRKGYTAHEYYGSTGNTNQWDMIIGSVDGGATWQSVGGTVAACNNSGCKFAHLAISPVDDSKVVASDGSTTFVPNLYYHPGFAAASGTGTVTSGQISLTGIIH